MAPAIQPAAIGVHGFFFFGGALIFALGSYLLVQLPTLFVSCAEIRDDEFSFLGFV